MDILEIHKQDIKVPFDRKSYQREYQKKYIKLHKEIWATTKTCQLCNSKFMAGNLTNHKRSKTHKYNLLIEENKVLKLNNKNITK
jgi:hypothetical protein